MCSRKSTACRLILCLHRLLRFFFVLNNVKCNTLMTRKKKIQENFLQSITYCFSISLQTIPLAWLGPAISFSFFLKEYLCIKYNFLLYQH